MSTEPALMSLAAVAKAIAERRLSSHEVTRSCLNRIARWQPHINAFMAIEAEAALKAADESDAALAAGRNLGPLHGVPLAHKDMYYDAGKVVTCGSLIRRDFVATTTSTALQRLKDAGSIRLGSLQMAEFAYGPTGHNVHYGAVHNPFAPDHITGGSSSGSGAAVAARLTFAALGSDTGGSVRMPAHFCGVTGLKTTYGRISRAGAMPLSQSLDTVGPLARSAVDCALLLALMAGADPDDPTASTTPVPDYLAATTASIKGLRIGVPTSFYVDDLDADVAAILEQTLGVLRREGAEIAKVELPDQRQLSAACQLVLAVEAAAFHKRWLIERPQDYGPQVLMRLRNGLAIPGVTYLEAMRWRGPALAAHIAATRNVDAVLAPVAPVAAPTIAESDIGNSPGAEAAIQRLTRLTRPINYLGLPSLSVPAGFTKESLPVGMQLIGRSFDEATLLRIGAAFQRVTDFHERVPEPVERTLGSPTVAAT
jgi:aspartyl-tRNA(Asn)/glutamyl-tRNA(Gln) amidotransferase subunit A